MPLWRCSWQADHDVAACGRAPFWAAAQGQVTGEQVTGLDRSVGLLAVESHPNACSISTVVLFSLSLYFTISQLYSISCPVSLSAIRLSPVSWCCGSWCFLSAIIVTWALCRRLVILRSAPLLSTSIFLFLLFLCCFLALVGFQAVRNFLEVLLRLDLAGCSTCAVLAAPSPRHGIPSIRPL